MVATARIAISRSLQERADNCGLFWARAGAPCLRNPRTSRPPAPIRLVDWGVHQPLWLRAARPRASNLRRSLSRSSFFALLAAGILVEQSFSRHLVNALP